DGEPKGTAGKPALNVLRHSGLTNVLVTIVRYFGGIELGKGGLVKAYTESVNNVLENLPSKKATIDVKMQLEFGYEQFEIVRKTLQDFGTRDEDRRFEDMVRLSIAVDGNLTESLKKELLSVTRGRIEIEIP
ncbi:MAG TPA: YigZ family protein, partial [Spirochaetota bacterium]|nr:YigZ family protein [Spirochaetota bacterium]